MTYRDQLPLALRLQQTPVQCRGKGDEMLCQFGHIRVEMEVPEQLETGAPASPRCRVTRRVIGVGASSLFAVALQG